MIVKSTAMSREAEAESAAMLEYRAEIQSIFDRHLSSIDQDADVINDIVSGPIARLAATLRSHPTTAGGKPGEGGLSAIMERVVDPLLAQLVTLREQLAAAEARAEEAEKTVSEHAEYIIDLEHLSYIRADLTWRDEASRLNAAISEERARVAGMRAAMKKASEEIAPLVYGRCGSCLRTNPSHGCTASDGNGGPGCGDGKRCWWQMPEFEPIASSVLRALTPEPPHEA